MAFSRICAGRMPCRIYGDLWKLTFESRRTPLPWAKGRPKRQATSPDWIEEDPSNRWRGIHLITRPVTH
ncbi:MAG: hypothetical protein JW384_00945 [Nitrosomonadaceae bacterium]|nr:hypothetical protein [Nitrosomonadaceae bacterium]